jgi:hypothetical protein
MEFGEFVSSVMNDKSGRDGSSSTFQSWLRSQPKGRCLEAFEGSAGQLKFLREHIDGEGIDLRLVLLS